MRKLMLVALLLLPVTVGADTFEQFTVRGTFLNRPNNGPRATLSGRFIVNQSTGKVVWVDFFHGNTELSIVTYARLVTGFPNVFVISVADSAGDILNLSFVSPQTDGSLTGLTDRFLCTGSTTDGCGGLGSNFNAYPHGFSENDDLLDGSITDAGPVVAVAIVIKPGAASPVAINARSHGTIPVAILSTTDFNAVADIQPGSLTFGRTGNEASLAFCNAAGEDVNGDGLPDLVCHFRTKLTGFQPGDTLAVLIGKTVQGGPIIGQEPISSVP